MILWVRLSTLKGMDGYMLSIDEKSESDNQKISRGGITKTSSFKVMFNHNWKRIFCVSLAADIRKSQSNEY